MTKKLPNEVPKLPKIVPTQCAAIAIQYMTPHHPNGDEYTALLTEALKEGNYEKAKETSALMCAAMAAFNHPMAAACIMYWEEAFNAVPGTSEDTAPTSGA